MLILASQSPRRRELLTMAGIDFTCVPSHFEEVIPAHANVPDIPRLLALGKARDVFSSHPEDTVLGSDTIVAYGDTVLGKPKSEEDAFGMLRLLSGKTHYVHTGVAILSPSGEESFVSSTEVEFYELTDDEIRAYIATGEPMDKAGAYAIQGKGFRFVKAIRGDYYTVMGLPLAETVRRLP